ncbi:hypothetical protein L1987_60719 [Smallanthus sonchifolius]|uniref:Uncharacterized protein n=1 Tax=Smallanthus sonchifolius TaxID=185202 RepID=A0ACB9D8R5_9ASTR|nr:hypothetical protein L1987_60719 [Smallanthus sonchifolius]
MQTSYSPASRRLPLPCWSNDETVSLIDAYRDKWYSLRRGNLRAPHWQEVADGVAVRCPSGNPPKTSIQCRHKMEKIRKRYRAEIQRIGNNRCPSSWVFFKLMDSMELGLGFSSPDPFGGKEDDEIEDDLMLHPKRIKQAIALPLNQGYQGSIANGVRIKIPYSAKYQNNRSFDDLPPDMNPQYGLDKGFRNGYSKEASVGEIEGIHGGGNVMNEMVAAIEKLGHGFVKMKRMKMDVARELESMRMKMEMKRTEMILEMQQKLWDSFSDTVMEKKNKRKRTPTPES